MHVDTEAAKILLCAQNSSDGLRQLLELRQSRVRSFSLAVLARRAELSKSYLSEVMSGKKLLNAKYVAAIAKALHLGILEANCLEALVAVAHAKNDATALTARERLAKSRRVLRLLAQDENHPEDVDLLAFDIYASFGMFGLRPSVEDLCLLFKGRPRTDILDCLDYLLTRKAIVHHSDGTYGYTEQGLVFSTDKNVRSFIPFWRQAARDAIEQMPNWAENREDSCFSSYVISVSMAEYRKNLEELKGRLLEFASACDSADADALVRVNMHVYPVKIK